MLIVHLFVSNSHVNLCHFFSTSWGWLRLLLAAFPGFFYLHFCENTTSYPSLFVRCKKQRMNEGRPIYYLPLLSGANRPEVEKLP